MKKRLIQHISLYFQFGEKICYFNFSILTVRKECNHSYTDGAPNSRFSTLSCKIYKISYHSDSSFIYDCKGSMANEIFGTVFVKSNGIHDDVLVVTLNESNGGFNFSFSSSLECLVKFTGGNSKFCSVS